MTKNYFDRGDVAYFPATPGKISELEQALLLWARYNGLKVSFRTGCFVTADGLNEWVVRMEKIGQEDIIFPEKKKRGRKKGLFIGEKRKEIIKALREGIKPMEVAKMFNVSKQYVYYIKDIDNI